MRPQCIDDDVLDDARLMSRILLTQNREDFKKLHRKGLPHQGRYKLRATATPDNVACSPRDACAANTPAGSGKRRFVANRISPNPRTKSKAGTKRLP